MFSTLVWIGYTETTDKKLHFSTPILPDFEHNTNKRFLDDVRKCTVYIYHYNKDFLTVNEEILLAQAALESGWGTSRFANEGNNLFGIRTYDLREPHMSPWKSQPKKWGVKVYKHKCDSVKHYIEILNNAEAYEEYRKMRAKGINDPFILLKTLDAYATDKNYFPKIKNIIKKIRAEYD